MPYDMNMPGGWDMAPTQQMLADISKQYDAVNNSQLSVIILWHALKHHTMVLAMLKERLYQQEIDCHWYKTDQTCVGPVSAHTLAVETFTVAFRTDRNNYPWNLSKNPVERHNLISCPSVVNHALDNGGQEINVTEKPAAVTKQIFATHTNPGTWVVIVGAGAGGDVKGALMAGCNVVAVERDERQYKALCYHMKEFARRLAETEDKSELEPLSVGFGIPREQKWAVVPAGAVSPSKARAPGLALPKCLCCGDDLGVDLIHHVQGADLSITKTALFHRKLQKRGVKRLINVKVVPSPMFELWEKRDNWVFFLLIFG